MARRFDLLHSHPMTVGKDLVDGAVLRLQHTLSGIQHPLPCGRKGRTRNGRELVFKLLDVLVRHVNLCGRQPSARSAGGNGIVPNCRASRFAPSAYGSLKPNHSRSATPPNGRNECDLDPAWAEPCSMQRKVRPRCVGSPVSAVAPVPTKPVAWRVP